MTFPPCFDNQAQYDNWDQADRFVSASNGGHAGHFCADCTMRYAHRMRAEGRCEHPEFVFDPKTGLPFVGAGGPGKIGATGYPGVTFHKRQNKFQAQLSVNGKTKNLGYFDDPQAAYEVWREAKSHGGKDQYVETQAKSNAVVHAEPSSAWLLRGKRRAKHANRKDRVQERPVRLRGFVVLEEKRSPVGPDYYAFEYIRPD